MGCSLCRKDLIKSQKEKRKTSQNYQFDIYAAIKSGRFELVKELTNSIFDIHYRMPAFSGRTMLHIASEYGRLKIVDYLLNLGAIVDCLDNSGLSPLFVALKSGHLDVAMELYKYGANPRIRTIHGLYLHDYINISKGKECLSLLRRMKYSRINLS